MARGFHINGAAMVQVKGNVTTAMAGLSELGLTADAITVTDTFFHDDITVNAWGRAPPDSQFMGSFSIIRMNLVHFDQAILDAVVQEAKGGAGAPGACAAAGTLMGGSVPRFAAGNHFIGLNITSPVDGAPFRFLYAFLTEQPIVTPIGTEKKVVQLSWKAIPYATDPWNGGLGLAGTVIWDRGIDA